MVCVSHISFSQIRYNLNNENQIAISYTNPKTNEVVYVPPRRKIHFKPGKIIRQELQQEWIEND